MIRAMVGEGMYYPGDPDDLRERLRRALAFAETAERDSRTILAPYGAYDVALPFLATAIRSGPVTPPQRVVILAPPNAASHGRALLPESTEFETPFGTLPVDRDAIAALAASSDAFVYDEIAHLRDHSIETALPVLHYVYDSVPIVPILIGSLTPAIAETLVTGLAPLITSDTLTVISANLSGFAAPEEADARARRMVRLLMTNRGHAVFRAAAILEDPPRSLWPIALGSALAGESTRPRIISRGMFETEFADDVGSVVFASIAYLP